MTPKRYEARLFQFSILIPIFRLLLNASILDPDLDMMFVRWIILNR